MRRLAVVVSALAFLAFAAAQARSQDAADVMKEMKAQIDQLRNELRALREENQRLRVMVVHQPAAQQGTQYPNLFPDQSNFQIYTTPGAAPPSWIDLLIERNRQRLVEQWERDRENERLADERLARIVAESRAIGVAYAPPPLRNVALAKESQEKIDAVRKQLVDARDADFKEIISQPEVQSYLQTKVDRLGGHTGATGAPGSPGATPGDAAAGDDAGRIAPATVRYLAERMKRDADDATILFGPGGLNGPAPGGFDLAVELTRQRRDTPNVLVNGPTRDALDAGRRSALVDAANSADVELEMVLRSRAIAEARRQLYGLGGASAEEIRHDLMQAQSVLNGKVSRTAVPKVHAAQDFQPPNN